MRINIFNKERSQCLIRAQITMDYLIVLMIIVPINTFDINFKNEESFKRFKYIHMYICMYLDTFRLSILAYFSKSSRFPHALL